MNKMNSIGGVVGISCLSLILILILEFFLGGLVIWGVIWVIDLIANTDILSKGGYITWCWVALIIGVFSTFIKRFFKK